MMRMGVRERDEWKGEGEERVEAAAVGEVRGRSRAGKRPLQAKL